ncbi:hypothetical protein HYDPIDRAFT_101523 [Hydnomerulius pinastri MD-312]|uniref:Uncharacterized protein n=1 Tax=Hydnomerulius pinastri MD-312 TaxID=994086 RepID=A0A0C9V186_9AGAM|nr:hypothetical protein HYDPIDRAFT_101523 [Hydnomerulius pinastri MD-312]
MPRLLADPNLEICPDYASEIYDAVCTALVDDHTTEQQAIQKLQAVWQAGNTAMKVQWQEQLNHEQEDWEEQARLAEERQVQLAQVEHDEEEAALKEERKKHKHKYTPIQDSGVPTETPVMPAAYALHRLQQSDYVKLWHFTNNGLDDALNTSLTTNDNAMVMSRLHDGAITWTPAANSRSSSTIIANQDLTFEEFCITCPQMITAMEQTNWTKERILMMATFWRNIQIHPFRSSRDPLAPKALLVYQAEQRRLWHITAKSPKGPYDLSMINEVLLEKTRTRVYWDERRKKDNERDYEVCRHVNAGNLVKHIISLPASHVFSMCSLMFDIPLSRNTLLHLAHLMPHALCFMPHASCFTLHTSLPHTTCLNYHWLYALRQIAESAVHCLR